MNSVLDLTTNPRASARLDVFDPATGEVVGRIPAGSPEAVDAAVRAARAAQPAWARTAPGDRAAALKAAARRLRAAAEELAELATREGGKPLADSLGGVEAGIAAIEQYAELGPLHRGRSLQGGWEAADLMVHEPRGVVALIVPWNDPIAIACGQIAAALVTGNAVVYKPSEKTPLSGARLVEILDLGDVLQLLHGDARAGRPLASHSRVDLVIHTGSVQTGRAVMEACVDRLGKALLELGGKDAMIVDEGVDPEWAAEQAALGAWANAGQICTSVERIFVHRDVAEPFLAALTRRAEALKVGDPRDPGTEMGPLIDEDQRDWVHNHVEDACHNGAELRAGGKVPEGPGCFYPPTVLVGPPGDAPVITQETFGPVAAVRVVDSFDDALEEANRGDFGLAAVVLTPSPANAQRAWRELEVGTVKVNAVFGGAPGGAAEPRRFSGHGFGYGPELLDEVTHTKVVHLAVAPPRPAES
jgi:succinate-semialdehyde dehydrogenase/glutarate-semialdehyde dehydrogenase